MVCPSQFSDQNMLTLELVHADLVTRDIVILWVYFLTISKFSISDQISASLWINPKSNCILQSIPWSLFTTEWPQKMEIVVKEARPIQNAAKHHAIRISNIVYDCLVCYARWDDILRYLSVPKFSNTEYKYWPCQYICCGRTPAGPGVKGIMMQFVHTNEEIHCTLRKGINKFCKW